MFKFSIVDVIFLYSISIVTYSQTPSPTQSPNKKKNDGNILGMSPVLFFIILAIILLLIFGIILYFFMKQKNKSNSNDPNDPNREKVELSNNRNKNNTNSKKNKLNSMPNDPHNPDPDIRRNSFRKFKSMEEAEKNGKTSAPSLKVQDEEIKPKYRKKRSRTLSETISRIFNIQITTPRGTDYSTGEYNKRRTSSNLDSINNNNNNNNNDNHHEELEQIQENNEEEVDDITPVTYQVNNNNNNKDLENGNSEIHYRNNSEEEIDDAYERYQKRRSLGEDEDDSDD